MVNSTLAMRFKRQFFEWSAMIRSTSALEFWTPWINVLANSLAVRSGNCPTAMKWSRLSPA